MTAEERIVELENELRAIQLNGLVRSEAEKSRLGNLYWNYNSDRHAMTRPYDGNDREFVRVFAEPEYAAFIACNQHLQDYWRSPMYCIKRSPDGYMEVTSNIHRGDFFGCGKTSQVGHVCRKITVIQCGLKPEHQKPSPAGPGENYLKYEIRGDIGGHWCEPSHDDFTSTTHFIWLPTPERLAFAGFMEEAKTLSEIMFSIAERMTAAAVEREAVK